MNKTTTTTTTKRLKQARYLFATNPKNQIIPGSDSLSCHSPSSLAHLHLLLSAHHRCCGCSCPLATSNPSRTGRCAVHHRHTTAAAVASEEMAHFTKHANGIDIAGWQIRVENRPCDSSAELEAYDAITNINMTESMTTNELHRCS
jgi:hypothetical protein